LFPGKTEGSQLIEQCAILGLPTREQLMKMSSQIDDTKIELVQKLDDMPKRDFKKVLPQVHYQPADLAQAADLIEKMLDWVPSQRISCE
jgi:DNA-directed RNA polymerase specialized sigma54-like protein